MLSVSTVWDKDAAARPFVEDYKLPYLVGRDGDGKIGALYNVDATPNTFFIDKGGVLRHRVEGEMTEADFEREIEKLLAS